MWLNEVAAQRVKERVRGQVIDRLLVLGPGYLARQRTGDVQTVAVEGVEALEAYFGRYLPSVGICLLGPVAILAYLTVLDWPLAVVIAVFVVLVPLAPRLWDTLTAATGEARWQAYSALDADYVDTTQGMTALKAFNATERVGAQLAARARYLYETTMRQLGVALVDTGLTTFGMLAGSAVAIGIAVVRVAEGGLALVTLFTVLFVARECFRPFGLLSTYWHVGFAGLSSSQQIAELLATEHEVAEPARPGTVDLTHLAPRIELDGVSFSYSTRETPALAELSLSVEPGERVAVVGPSGAGKSTIVALLLRFFDPQSGVVRLGGIDVRELPLATVRAATAVVSQDTYLFHGTIAENIRLGRPEATSNVDAASEAAIQQALSRLTSGRTTLVIAHRLSTVRDADRIVVLAEGRATETGRHDELLAHRGGYAQLIAAQQGASS